MLEGLECCKVLAPEQYTKITWSSIFLRGGSYPIVDGSVFSFGHSARMFSLLQLGSLNPLVAMRPRFIIDADQAKEFGS